MDIEKIRNLGDEELHAQEHDAADQLFRLRFQLKMGQTESVTKMRTLRKDIARIKTVMRQRELGQTPVPVSAVATKKTKTAPAEETATKTSAKAAAPAAKKTAAKKAAKPAAKKAAKKKPEKK
jgi:large subunit ribosomal protein L29